MNIIGKIVVEVKEWGNSQVIVIPKKLRKKLEKGESYLVYILEWNEYKIDINEENKKDP